MKIEYSNEKSDYVKQSLEVKDGFSEEYSRPIIFWVPVILLSMIALDYFTYGLRETISQFFPEADPTIPFVLGLVFGTFYTFAIFGLFMFRRWTIYLTILIMIGEWFYYSGFNLLIFRTIDGQKAFYPMFGEGLVPWVTGLEPIYSLIVRQALVVLLLLLLWKRLQ